MWLRRLVPVLVVLALAQAQNTTTSTSSHPDEPSAAPSTSSPNSSSDEPPLNSTLEPAPSSPSVQSSIPSSLASTSDDTASFSSSTSLAANTNVSSSLPTTTASTITATTDPASERSATPTSNRAPIAHESLEDVVAEIEHPPSPPSQPEFLSFQEWRDKYVVTPDPSARRARKAAQRARQDAGTSKEATAFDGDGADFRSLFAGGEEGSQIVYEGNGDEGPLVVQLNGKGEIQNAVQLPVKESAIRTLGGADSSTGGHSSSSTVKGGSSVIQPLPNVGTGEIDDPLLHLKDRSNYALFECAAMVHRSSRGTKGASSILVEKKDRYMLTPCSVERKFVELELCDEIRIDTLVVANFELFSSMFKNFEIKVSQNYPGRPDEWHSLGTFRARNIRGLQVFRPDSSLLGFYRYMRVDFTTHYGSEFYCPVSLLRVYGLTHVDAWRRDEEQAKAREAALAALSFDDDDDDEEDAVADSKASLGDLDVRPVEPETKWQSDGSGTNSTEATQETSSSTEVESAGQPPDPTSSAVSSQSTGQSSAFEPDSSPQTFSASRDVSESPEPSTPTGSSLPSHTESSAPPSAVDENASQPTISSSTSASTTRVDQSESPSSSGNLDASSSDAPPSPIPHSPTITSNLEADTAIVSTVPKASSTGSSTDNQTSRSSSSSDTAARPSLNDSSDLPGGNVTQVSVTVPSASESSVGTASSNRPTETVQTRPHHHQARDETYSPPHRPVIPPPVQQPQPGESIYGGIMKRLGILERNQTLETQYIEAQSAMLREAFLRLDRRLADVEAARTKHDQIIRQGLLDLELYNKVADRDKLALASQINLLTRELVLEKRLGLAQLVALLVLFVFVGVTRGSPTTPFLHMVQPQAFRRRTKKDDVTSRDTGRRDEDRGAQESSTEGILRKQSLQRSTSVSARASVGKRFSVPKSAPRRHYGGATPSSHRPGNSRRPWTPPPRPFAVDDTFTSSLTAAHARRSHNKSPQPKSPLQRPFLMSAPSGFSAQDADLDPSLSDLEGFRIITPGSAPEEGGYRTFSGDSESEAEEGENAVFVRPPKSPSVWKDHATPRAAPVVPHSPAPQRRLPEAPPEPRPADEAKVPSAPSSGLS